MCSSLVMKALQRRFQVTTVNINLMFTYSLIIDIYILHVLTIKTKQDSNGMWSSYKITQSSLVIFAVMGKILRDPVVD